MDDLDALDKVADGLSLLDEELEAKTFEKYLDINRKLVQLTSDFKQNYKTIVKNEETYYENLTRLEKIKIDKIKKRVETSPKEPTNEEMAKFMKTDLGKAIFYLSREINKNKH